MDGRGFYCMDGVTVWMVGFFYCVDRRGFFTVWIVGVFFTVWIVGVFLLCGS